MANIVPMTKKNDKILICINSRDLNTACPKDEFSFPITDDMVDNMCRFVRMSFMDECAYVGDACHMVRMSVIW